MSDVPQDIHWKRLNRKTIFSNEYANFYLDDIKIPSGDVIEGYSVVNFPDGVIIVATDTEGRLVTINEYKYAVDRIVLGLPAGSIDGDESLIDAAKRELLEETGYTGEDFEIVRKVYDYPSKLDYSLNIIRAKNVYKIGDSNHQFGEQISPVHLLSPDMENYGGELNVNSVISALALTLPEYIR